MSPGKHNPELQEHMTSNNDEPPPPVVTQVAGRGKKAKSGERRDTPTDLQVRQQVIGSELRRMFQEVVNEPVPAEMLELLQRIEKQAD